MLAIVVNIDPVAFSFGPVAIRWYGIGYMVAIAVGLRMAYLYALSRGIEEDQFWTVADWGIPFGMLGGRLYYVIQNNPIAYLANPGEILAIWHGGMAYFGAVFAAIAVAATLAWRRHWALGPMLDATALFALIGQPIGRLGNVINGDIVGAATTLPWGFVYAHSRSFVADHTIAVHPAAAYEILANLTLISLLFPLRDRLGRGWFAAAYVAAYCLSQLVVFMWRSEPIIAFGLRQGQLTALTVLAAEAVWMALWLRRSAVPPSRAEDIRPAGEVGAA